MKQIYALLLIVGTVATAMASRAENRQSVTLHRAPATDISVAETPAKMPARQTPGKMVISDLEKQVYGRYTCEYYSPIPDENNVPYGWCQEQPLVVEDFFGESGDVNIGYLFLQSAILKGKVDMENGTLTIPSRKAITYYEDPDNYDDPGKPVYFVTVDVVNGKYAANYDRPLVCRFELHNGIITKMTTDDTWGYVVQDNDGNDIGWFEIAQNSSFYLGHGEMEYTVGGQTQATVIHAQSNGTKAWVYNAFRTGWETPIEITVNDPAKTAQIVNQSFLSGEDRYFFTNADHATEVNGIIRDVDWDLDKRDPNPNSVLDFGNMSICKEGSPESIADFGNVRFYFKEDVSEDHTTAIRDIEVADVLDATVPVEYYNLQGVRVANPGKGLYIRRQGIRAEKVILP